ncbi:MAG: DUF2332 domain-containing protein [bacterium]|nr:DUF2332 domain-containing protein [bacterium]
MIEGLNFAFEIQARICAGTGGPFYAQILEHCARELTHGEDSPLARLVSDWEGDLARDFLPLRVLAGVHDLVLAGEAPELARHYPSAGGLPEFPSAWTRFNEVLGSHHAKLRPWLDRVPQTNEVQRSVSLLGGFLEIARRFGHPLRTRELGASAGFNLYWDRHHYVLGSHRLGPESAPIELECQWSGPVPPLGAPAVVEGRAGCDRSPIDVRNPEQRRGLEAWIWPDHFDRRERMKLAIEMVEREPPRLDTARAGDWIAKELAGGWPEGVTLVVYHSSFWIYLDAEEQQRILEELTRAGAAATTGRPLAWLRAEDDGPGISLRLTTWPEGRDERLAAIHPHGRTVSWEAPTR